MAMDDKKFFSTSAGVLANGLSGLKTNVEEAQGISTEVEAAGGVPADLSSSQALAATMAGGGLDQSTIESLMAVANTAGGGGPGVGRRRSGMSAYACGPTRVIDFQPWITLIGTSSTPDVIQPARTWLNGESMPTCNMKILITAITQCTLVLESAPSGEGPWTQVQAFTQAADNMLVASSEGGPCQFSKYIRWKVDKAGNAWKVCFQVRAMPGKSAAELKLTPRNA